MNEYRRARSIELYDAGVIVRLTPDEGGGFHDFTFPGYQIYAFHLARWARALGIELQRTPTPWPDGPLTAPHKLEFELFRPTVMAHDGCESVTQILAMVTEANLLEIETTSIWKDVESGELIEHIDSFTYNGSFSIDWIEPPPPVLLAE